MITKDVLIEKTDLAINELVYDKEDLRKAYNYYNCKRDKEQFKYLEENFGIGQPTAVEFIPLIRKHIDALVGEYLNVPILPKNQIIRVVILSILVIGIYHLMYLLHHFLH